MNKIFNRFEWNKIVCKSKEKLKKSFPANHLVGKKIKSFNAIGSIEKPDSWNLQYWKIMDSRKPEYCNFELIEKNSDEENVSCEFYGNEPFVIVFDDDSTFELQLLWQRDYCFSENQISPDIKDGINYCEMDASVLFQELIGSVIKDIQVDEKIIFNTDSGFSLRINFASSNQTLYELCKNGECVQKKLSTCLKSLLGVEQIEIQDRHNTSSYFWIEPATEQESIEKGEFGVVYASSARISIEEDYVYDYLAYFLKEYYKPENHKICRGEDNKNFEWNLDPNLYKYAEMGKMLSEIKETCLILRADFNDKRLDEWKKYSIGRNFRNKKEKLSQTRLVKSRVKIIIDFYERFCFQIEEMMRRFPNYECIDFMGP